MRALAAEEILWIWEVGERQHPVVRPLTILAATLPRASWEELADLPIARRDARLLGVRAATFGATMESYAECPACGSPLEFTLDAAALAGSVGSGDGAVQEGVELQEGGYRIHARLPGTRDLLAVAGAGDARAARRLLAERCVVEAEREGIAVAAGELTDAIVDRVGDRIAGCDPGAEILLALDCPDCGHSWSSTFDAAEFLWTEIRAYARGLLREVHQLAGAYGWSEAEILGMTPTRRGFYLEQVRR
jgi:hypothetical protein